MREGDKADRVLVLLTGRTRVLIAADGRLRLLCLRGPGDVVGEVGAALGSRRGATITAAEPVTYATLAASEFRRRLAGDPALATSLVRHMGRRLREADRRQVERMVGDTTRRVAGCLAELSDGRRAPVAVPLTQPDLAELAGASLEATARALRTLREAGHVQTRRGTILVLDPAALART